MQVHVHRWISRHGDCGAYRVTVTLYSDTVTVALTFPGPLTRKQALEKTFDNLAREGTWSPSFLQAVKALLSRPRKGEQPCTP